MTNHPTPGTDRAARSRKLHAQALGVLPGGVNSASRGSTGVSAEGDYGTLYLVSGDGCRVTDLDGSTYVDHHLCAGAALLGHGHPSVASAVRQQLSNGTCFASSHDLEVEVGSKLQGIVPSLDRLRFCGSGSEAVIAAVNLARTKSGKQLVICFDGCFHGWIFDKTAADSLLLPLSNVQAVREALALHHDRIGAVLIDPCPASEGLIVLEPAYLAELRYLCDRYEICLIFDEIITGFRLSLAGAQGVYGVTPDMSIFGKVLGGGMPIGLFGGRGDIMAALAPGGAYRQGGTFAAHPLSLAAAKAVLDELVTAPPYEQLEESAAAFWNAVDRSLRDAGSRLRVSRSGSIASLYVTPGTPENARERAERALPNFPAFYRALLDRGVFISPGAPKSWYLSTVHSSADLDHVSEAILFAANASDCGKRK